MQPKTWKSSCKRRSDRIRRSQFASGTEASRPCSDLLALHRGARTCFQSDMPKENEDFHIVLFNTLSSKPEQEPHHIDLTRRALAAKPHAGPSKITLSNLAAPNPAPQVETATTRKTSAFPSPNPVLLPQPPEAAGRSHHGSPKTCPKWPNPSGLRFLGV